MCVRLPTCVCAATNMCVCLIQLHGVYFARNIPQTVGPIAGPSCSLGKHNGSFSSQLLYMYTYNAVLQQCTPAVSYYYVHCSPVCMYLYSRSTTDHCLLFCLWVPTSPTHILHCIIVIVLPLFTPHVSSMCVCVCVCVCALLCFDAMIRGVEILAPLEKTLW